MAYEENLKSLSHNADASVGIYTGVPGQPGSAVPNSGKQYCGLKLTGTNQVGLATAAGDNLIGVLQNKPQVPGAAATVGVQGITKVRAGAAFAADVELVVDGTGRFIAGSTTGKGLKLISVMPASVADEVVSARIIG